MKNEESFVKLYRSAKKDPTFKNPRAWQMFSYCMMTAEAWANKPGIEFGTFITSYPELMEDLNIGSKATVSKFLKFLKEDGKIEYSNNHQQTIIKVINFGKYNPPTK